MAAAAQTIMSAEAAIGAGGAPRGAAACAGYGQSEQDAGSSGTSSSPDRLLRSSPSRSAITLRIGPLSSVR
jgi:hypothetical protein